MQVRPTIAVVGASVRSAAFSLLRAGCRVVAADLFADADLKRECAVTRIADYPAKLFDWLAKTECDGWLYTGAIENHPDLIDLMAELKLLLGISGDSLRRVRDPILLQKALRAAGPNFPETKSCNGSPPCDGQWLHKTGQGGNGSGVSHHQSEPPGLPRRATTSKNGPSNSQRKGYWQRRIEGTPGSALFINAELQGITQQLIAEPWTGACEFQYCGTLAPWLLPPSATAEITRLGEVLAEQFNLHGLFGVDFVFDGEQAWPLEVNPRVTAAVEIVERVAGTNLLAKHLAAFGIAADDLRQEAVAASGKAILYAKHPLAVSRSMSESLLARAGPRDSPQLADIPNPDMQIAVGEPILTVLSDGSSTGAVVAELRERVAAMEHELYRG